MNYFISENKEKISFIDIIYPVGSIYMSVNNTSPSTLFEGTTWSKIEGRFLLGSSDEYELSTEGGEASHTLTVDEIPAHTHTYQRNARSSRAESSGVRPAGYSVNSGVSNYTTTSVGGEKSHNNMPPYFVVNIWERTA